jgi:hypothetical protein
MASCPNCHATIALACATCERCGAVFAGAESWKPIPTSDQERVELAARVPPVQPELLRKPNLPSLLVALAALALYFTALCLPTILFERTQPLIGYYILLWGWWGILAGSLAWYANIVLLFAARYYFKGRSGRAAAAACIALGLAATAPLAREWWFTEAGGTQISGLGLGYRFWLGSIALFVLATFLALFPWSARRTKVAP